MSKDESGTRWAQCPMHGAVGAGRQDEFLAVPDGFGLTPSGEDELKKAAFIAAMEAHKAENPEREVPDGGSGPESLGRG